MKKRKRRKKRKKTFGEIRYSKKIMEIAEQNVDTEISEKDLVLIIFGFHLESAMHEYINVKIGFYERGGYDDIVNTQDKKIPTEEEALAQLVEAWIGELAVDGYHRKLSVSDGVRQFNEFAIRVEQKIAKGEELIDKQEHEYKRLYAGTYTIKELQAGIAIAKETEDLLRKEYPRSHPFVKARKKELNTITEQTLAEESEPPHASHTETNRH